MKRFWTGMVTTACVIIAGCGVASYEKRTEATLEQMKRQQKIDKYLAGPAEGKLKELNVYLRVPSFLVEGPLALNQTPGMFDHGATYLGAPKQPEPAADSKAAPPPPLPPMRLHVLVRQKPKKAAGKKGEPAPPPDPNTANRGDFINDVRQVLLAEYGPDANPEKAPQGITIKGTSFKRQLFNAANGNAVQVYFADANKGELAAALVFEIPPGLAKDATARDSRELCLEEFKIGPRARSKFSGNAAEGAKAEATEGPAF